MSTKRSTNTRKRQQRRYLKSTIARRDHVLLEYRWREQSLCDKRSRRSHSARSLLWGLTPFYQTQDWASFRESSPISISLTVNYHHQFLGIKIGLTPSSGYFSALSGEIQILSLKTSGWRHCKSSILLDSHWTCHKPYRGKSNAVHSIYMSQCVHKTSIN